MKHIILKSVLSAALAIGTAAAGETGLMRHGIAAGEEGKFYGQPANNGVWTWDNDQ